MGGLSGSRDRRGTIAPIFIFGDFLHQELHSAAASQSPMGQNPGPGTAFWGLAGWLAWGRRTLVQHSKRFSSASGLETSRPVNRLGRLLADSQPPESPFPEL